MSDVNCVFWNIGANTPVEMIARLVDNREVHVLCLAECGFEIDLVIKAIEKRTKCRFHHPDTSVAKLILLCRDGRYGLGERYGDITNRLTIRELSYDQTAFNFVAVHLVDRKNFSDHGQAAAARDLADQIRAHEARSGHERTILCGDINMNPYSVGVVQGNGLNAMPTKHCVKRRQMTIQGRSYPFLYNPMWKFFGDDSPGPPGTNYYPKRDDYGGLNWHILDQVLVRPDALPWFDSVEIVTEIDGQSLTRNFRPNRRQFSDHYPILFKLRKSENV